VARDFFWHDNSTQTRPRPFTPISTDEGETDRRAAASGCQTVALQCTEARCSAPSGRKQPSIFAQQAQEFLVTALNDSCAHRLLMSPPVQKSGASSFATTERSVSKRSSGAEAIQQSPPNLARSARPFHLPLQRSTIRRHPETLDPGSQAHEPLPPFMPTGGVQTQTPAIGDCRSFTV